MGVMIKGLTNLGWGAYSSNIFHPIILKNMSVIGKNMSDLNEIISDIVNLMCRSEINVCIQQSLHRVERENVLLLSN